MFVITEKIMKRPTLDLFHVDTVFKDGAGNIFLLPCRRASIIIHSSQLTKSDRQQLPDKIMIMPIYLRNNNKNVRVFVVFSLHPMLWKISLVGPRARQDALEKK
jgi:hypothetical protein